MKQKKLFDLLKNNTYFKKIEKINFLFKFFYGLSAPPP